MRFDVFQQFPPTKVADDEYAANVVRVGQIDAPTLGAALERAREWSRFKITSALARFPIVSEARE